MPSTIIWPPSSIGIGNKFITPRLKEIAINTESKPMNPLAKTVVMMIWPMPIGPETVSRAERSPVPTWPNALPVSRSILEF